MKDQITIDPTEAFNSALSGLSQNGVPMQSDKQEVHVCYFREALMDEILAEKPGLTRAELSDQMDLMGF